MHHFFDAGNTVSTDVLSMHCFAAIADVPLTDLLYAQLLVMGNWTLTLILVVGSDGALVEVGETKGWFGCGTGVRVNTILVTKLCFTE
jgi:hypothetical protein